MLTGLAPVPRLGVSVRRRPRVPAKLEQREVQLSDLEFPLTAIDAGGQTHAFVARIAAPVWDAGAGQYVSGYALESGDLGGTTIGASPTLAVRFALLQLSVKIDHRLSHLTFRNGRGEVMPLWLDGLL